MDRVFDEYLRYLKESVNQEDAAPAGKPGRKGARRGGPRGKTASRTLKRYREATRGTGSGATEADEIEEA